ncbi:MAG: PatB family C-S lyase [Eubacteriales bacterium]|nr:PatB family C-S lyase [Eubacteriales bacterium]
MSRDYKAIFEQGVNRENSNATKWDNRLSSFGKADIVPMWIADTDFPTPQEVIDALVARAQHGAFGYSAGKSGDKAACVRWMQHRHGVEGLSEEMLMFTPGVVDGLYMAVLALTEPGDKVAIQPPVYGPFHMVTTKAGRELYYNHLKCDENGRYTMDLENLEEGLKQGVKMLILCSPHNPVGRVWTEQELTDLVALMNRYNAVILSDEIHADLILPGHKHTSLCRVPGAESALVCVAPSKTFNLAGLHHSFMIIRDEKEREVITAKAKECGLAGSSLFGEVACAAAYTHGEPWLNAQNEYIDENRKFVEEYMAANVPDVKVTRIEGTFLIWLDFTAWGRSEAELKELLVRSGVGMNGGSFFGKEYSTFCRMNIGTPRFNVEKGLAAIKAAYDEVHA